MEKRTMKVRHLGAIGAAMGIAACSYAPANNSQIQHVTDPITWAGYTDVPNQGVHAYVLSAIGTTLEVGTATTATTPTADAKNVNWYQWTKTITLPNDRQYWNATAPHELSAQFMTFREDTPGNVGMNPLVTFDATAGTCIQTNQSGGGQQIMDKCKSQTSGLVIVKAACGTFNSQCCRGANGVPQGGAACDSGLKCTGPTNTGFGTCLKDVGGSCSVNTDCTTGTSCKNGVCTAPSPAGSPCSVNADCVSGTTCKSGVCSISCNPGAACDTGKSGICAAGTLSCTPTTKTCTQTRQPTTETCDGLDNDCDGIKDDGIPSTTCQTTPSDCPGKTITGHTSCSGGQVLCDAKNGVDYCTIGGDAVCGGVFGQSCDSSHLCVPGVACTNFQCQKAVCDAACWLPSDVGKGFCP